MEACINDFHFAHSEFRIHPKRMPVNTRSGFNLNSCADSQLNEADTRIKPLIAVTVNISQHIYSVLVRGEAFYVFLPENKLKTFSFKKKKICSSFLFNSLYKETDKVLKVAEFPKLAFIMVVCLSNLLYKCV